MRAISLTITLVITRELSILIFDKLKETRFQKLNLHLIKSNYSRNRWWQSYYRADQSIIFFNGNFLVCANSHSWKLEEKEVKEKKRKRKQIIYQNKKTQMYNRWTELIVFVFWSVDIRSSFFILQHDMVCWWTSCWPRNS